MKALSRGFPVLMRSRHWSSTATAVVSFERIFRANSSMVKGLTGIGDVVGVAAEARAAKQLRGLGEALKERLELGESPVFGVGDGGFQPVFDSHNCDGPAEAGHYVRPWSA